MTEPSLHRWFKRALERAGLPSTIKLHEMRHSAADNAYRETGDIVVAQQLLRHESVATTQGYLHPKREDLAKALGRLQVVRSPSQSQAD
jgi:site-specific recombinase XerD